MRSDRIAASDRPVIMVHTTSLFAGARIAQVMANSDTLYAVYDDP